jgi:hypothetical protein
MGSGEKPMEILLAAWLMLYGGMSADHPDLTVEQLVAAAAQSNNPPISAPSGETGLVKIDPQLNTAPQVKGVYVTSHTTGVKKFQTLLQLMDDTDLNSMVIDIKDDWGYITYRTGNAELEALGTTQPIIKDIDKLMTTLDEHDIYPIARIVVFKDTVLAKKQPELSFLNPDGSVWGNGKKQPESFVNPYRPEVWEYNVNVAKEAAKVGFKEIQFDYVRFPEGFEKRADILTYDQDERSRVDAVTDFVKYAREQLEPLGVRVSVDIFGYAASVPAAEGIGQDFEKISNQVHVIAPMVYPSHYGTGWFGSKVPDAAPYATINGAMIDTHKKLEPLGDAKPIIRPWIQDFTASWIPGYIKYGKKEIEEQIRALEDNGIHEFLLWNAGNNYTPGVEYVIKK